MADPVHLPNWHNVAFHPGVLRESALNDRRLVLWLPVERESNCQHWQRISVAPNSEVIEHKGLMSIAATMISARQQVRRTFRTLLRHFRRGSEENIWRLPTGEEAEQVGMRRNDLLLVWTDNNQLLDEARIHELWPQSSRVQSLGPQLFLVLGVVATQAKSLANQPLLEQASPQQAEKWLAEARHNGDRVQEALVLADMGLMAFDEGKIPQATARLEESLALARSLGDQAREGDVLGILGLVVFKDGRLDEACQYLEQALRLLRTAGDRFTEKLTLERLATVRALRGEIPLALSLLNDALTLTRTLGDRQHEADLFWHLAILQAESGQQEQALDFGQQAVEILQSLGRPQAGVYADHLQQYRRGEATTVRPVVSGATLSQGLPTSSPLPKLGPTYLRMAISAAQAFGQFVGSGMKTVSAETLQERFQRCRGCDYYTGMRCRICGCFVQLKARLPYEDCPLGKWPQPLR